MKILSIKNFRAVITLVLTAFSYSLFPQAAHPLIGKKPCVATEKNRIAIAYGKDRDLYYLESNDEGKTFSDVQKISTIPARIALAMGRGPKIAIYKGTIVITCVDLKGNVYAIQKGANTKWSIPKQINSVPGKAGEGFCSLTVDSKGIYYAVWHDFRMENQNALFGTISKDGGNSWLKDKLIYASPDTGKSICPCCNSSLISDNKGKVYVMWRNLIQGSRDLYIMPFDQSKKALKMGTGTWKINACPMDGGSLSADSKGLITTIWRRENKMYTCIPGQQEIPLGEGRNPAITNTDKGNFMVWQNDGNIMLLTPSMKEPKVIGKGDYPKIASLSSGKVIVVWEGMEELINLQIVN